MRKEKDGEVMNNEEKALNSENSIEEETQNTEEQEAEENIEEANNNDIETLQQELAEATQKSEEYFDRLQRTMAEFNNFKKRTIKEKENLYSNAVGDTISEILPVLDNLDRAISSSNEQTDSIQIIEGVQMVIKQFKDCLSKLGVEEIVAIGETFNPELHNAVMHVEDETVGDSIIIEEFQKGFKVKDKVIRHSMVKVAN